MTELKVTGQALERGWLWLKLIARNYITPTVSYHDPRPLALENRMKLEAKQFALVVLTNDVDTIKNALIQLTRCGLVEF